MRFLARTVVASFFIAALAFPATTIRAQRTVKPPLHGRHWVAITGKPLGATAGAMMFQKGGNAVDAACAMLAAVATMWDTLCVGRRDAGADLQPEDEEGHRHQRARRRRRPARRRSSIRQKDMQYPPEYGPLAAVTPGTPGGLMVMLAEFGTLSLEDVLAPAIEMADGYPIEAQAADAIERQKDRDQEVAVLEGRVPPARRRGA